MKGFSYPPGGPPADLLVEGHGETLEEAFEQVALAMYNAVTPLEGITARLDYAVKADGTDLQNLLFNFLGELLYRIDADSLVARSIDVLIDQQKFTLSAICHGEKFSQKTHQVGASIKAPTYHMMKITEAQSGWMIQAVFDT